MKKVRDFFWFCSGSNMSLLKRCPTETAKYAGIGGTVLFTGIFAAVSSFFALYTVFRIEWIAIVFGILWGCMIFNIDRYIVSSMRKHGSFFKDLGMAAPRLILAVLLAFVIAKPLELKIFEREILREIAAKQTEQAIEAREAVDQNYPEIEELQSRITELRQEIRDKEEYRNEKQEEYDLERFGVQTSSTSGIPGIGRHARIKEQQLNEAQQDLEQTRKRNFEQIEFFNNRIKELYAIRDQQFDNQRTAIAGYDGFAARIDALSELTSKSRSIYLAHLFIIMLFIAVETAPIFVKLISPKGPYDDLLEKHEYEFAKNKQREIARIDHETHERLVFLDEKSKNTIRREKEVNMITNKEFANAEIEIAKKSIRKWKEDELKELSKVNSDKNNGLPKPVK